jgi:hypothetical protein
MCFFRKVAENSLLAMVLVRSLLMRLLRNSFSKIFLML